MGSATSATTARKMRRMSSLSSTIITDPIRDTCHPRVGCAPLFTPTRCLPAGLPGLERRALAVLLGRAVPGAGHRRVRRTRKVLVDGVVVDGRRPRVALHGEIAADRIPGAAHNVRRADRH